MKQFRYQEGDPRPTVRPVMVDGERQIEVMLPHLGYGAVGNATHLRRFIASASADCPPQYEEIFADLIGKIEALLPWADGKADA